MAARFHEHGVLIALSSYDRALQLRVSSHARKRARPLGLPRPGGEDSIVHRASVCGVCTGDGAPAPPL